MVVDVGGVSSAFTSFSAPTPSIKDRIYIGFTVNPERRIQQHNGGKQKGGACPRRQVGGAPVTGSGPSAPDTQRDVYNVSDFSFSYRDMVLIVHGFPNDIAALRVRTMWYRNKEQAEVSGCEWSTGVLGAALGFEWPGSTRTSLAGSPTSHARQRNSPALTSTSWSSTTCCAWPPGSAYPLTLRWLRQEYHRALPPPLLQPPLHMPPLAYGQVRAKPIGKTPGEKGDGEETGRPTAGVTQRCRSAPTNYR
ncbi:unnamed protein product [Ranitomeya imitator]|uniref:GIY-YIG domain-containing protein n=1 Tax=Ranitomeya imitator TaxID=111125 RepID=A0ABN9KRJ6_9NEOB|nr:unnamed protein product [Ranitomeya imitator]